MRKNTEYSVRKEHGVLGEEEHGVLGVNEEHGVLGVNEEHGVLGNCRTRSTRLL